MKTTGMSSRRPNLRAIGPWNASRLNWQSGQIVATVSAPRSVASRKSAKDSCIVASGIVSAAAPPQYTEALVKFIDANDPK